MNKFNLKFAAQQLTKEQMKKIDGGKNCVGFLDCWDYNTGYAGPMGGYFDCNDGNQSVNDSLCDSQYPGSNADSCTCSY